MMFVQSSRVVVTGLMAAISLAACGAESRITPIPAQEDPTEQPLRAPTIRLVSPFIWSAGDTITALGSDFVEPRRGRTELRFEGEFSPSDGAKRPVDMVADATWQNSGKISFIFEAAFPPEGIGHATGAFVGTVRAVNIGHDGEEAEANDAKVLAVEVGPSVAIWQVAPTSRGCGEDRIDATLSGETIAVDLQTIGLTPATTYTPVIIRAGWIDAAGETQTTQHRITAGTRQRFELDVGDLPQGAPAAAVLFDFTVEDGNGTTLNRVLQVDVGGEFGVDYDGNIRIVELFEPVPVSSCLPGGQYGSNVSYSSGTSESRSRSVSLSASLSVSVWVLSASFGINVSSSVSSSESESLSLSGRVIPGQFGVFYRQTQRLERSGEIVRRNACGSETIVGRAQVTDWNWAPDLAITTNGVCPPIPSSNLPAAQVMP